MPFPMQYIAHPAPTLLLSSLDPSVYNTIDWSGSDDIHCRCIFIVLGCYIVDNVCSRIEGDR
jgi:hypothetical protein